MKFKVEEKILNEVLDYLQTKPFKEVSNIISKLINGAEKVEDNIKPEIVENPKTKGKKNE